VNVDENRNVETLRRFYDTVNEGGIAAALPLVEEFCHPVVVTSTKLVGAGRGSGVPVELEMATVMQFESSKLRRGVVHRSRQEAMAAAMELADA
jgi:hypothetical protein